MISVHDSGTHDINLVEYLDINANLRYVNNFHSSIQCHGNGNAISSVCTKLYSWLMFVQACLFVHFFLVNVFFYLLFVTNLCHGCVTVPRREIPE